MEPYPSQRARDIGEAMLAGLFSVLYLASLGLRAEWHGAGLHVEILSAVVVVIWLATRIARVLVSPRSIWTRKCLLLVDAGLLAALIAAILSYLLGAKQPTPAERVCGYAVAALAASALVRVMLRVVCCRQRKAG